MKKLPLLFVVLSWSFLAYADDLNLACESRGGLVKSYYTRHKSNIPLPVRTCVFENSYGETQFFNGCSGPSGGHNSLFYSSCIKHDLCYHHEPATNGYTQKVCDQNFLNNMLEACESGANNKSKCVRWAKTLYRGLRIIGTPAFHCANELSKGYE
jgi:hypothetical protein